MLFKLFKINEQIPLFSLQNSKFAPHAAIHLLETERINLGGILYTVSYSKKKFLN